MYSTTADLVGRHGDKIIGGGEKVYPLDVEQVFDAHPLVAEATVVGVLDPVLGERIAAFLVCTDPTSPLDLERLRAFARERLSGLKMPAAWEIMLELPRNPSGKVLRRALKDRARQTISPYHSGVTA